MNLKALKEAAEAGWSDDWSAAPRDGTYVELRLPEGNTLTLRWSDHYSIFGLGGCWTDGFCTMGDKIDFTHWRPAPVLDALHDAYSGWRYIRSTHGELYGVGWDRVEKKLQEAHDAYVSSLANPSTILSLIERVEAMEDALRAASEVVNVAEKMTGCRGDDDWIWGVQEKITTALSTITKE